MYWWVDGYLHSVTEAEDTRVGSNSKDETSPTRKEYSLIPVRADLIQEMAALIL